MGRPRLEKPGQTPTEIWLAYISGYLDGDGCFRVNNGSPEVSATNAFPYTLRQLQAMFGGGISVEKAKDRCRTIYKWRLYGDPAIDLVHALRPYLWEKLPQAELLIAIRAESPGAKRDGLIKQLGQLKRIDYKKEE